MCLIWNGLGITLKNLGRNFESSLQFLRYLINGICAYIETWRFLVFKILREPEKNLDTFFYVLQSTIYLRSRKYYLSTKNRYIRLYFLEMEFGKKNFFFSQKSWFSVMIKIFVKEVVTSSYLLFVLLNMLEIKLQLAVSNDVSIFYERESSVLV